DSAMATFAMLLPHYIQYMGIVWLLHRRKFGNEAPAPASTPQSILVRLSTDLRLLLPVLAAIGAAFYVGSVMSRRHGFFPHFAAPGRRTASPSARRGSAFSISHLPDISR